MVFGSGLLSQAEIEQYNLIPESERGDGCLQAASYDLRVGNKHFVFEESGHWKAIFLGEPEELLKANENLPPDSAITMQLPHHNYNTLVIPPFGSAIIQLQETIDLLSVANQNDILIAGRFDLKLKAIYKGLISQQATQVEPCYKGKLYCFVHNLGSHAVTLTKGDKFATIEFSYVGQGLRKSQRKAIIKVTKDRNADKYSCGSFVEKDTGIKDIRWLQGDRLPEECGIAPIYNLVHTNIKDEVEKNLEKSSTIDKITERVEIRLREKQNLIKILISLIAAVITYFTTNLFMEINSELKYFGEELSFLIESHSELHESSIDAIVNHTKELHNIRSTMWIVSLLLLLVIIVLIIWFFKSFSKPSKEQEWELKRKALQAELEYKEYKRIYDGECEKNHDGKDLMEEENDRF